MKTVLISLMLGFLFLSGCTAQQAAAIGQGMSAWSAQENSRIAAQQNAVAQIYSRQPSYRAPVNTYGTITTPTGNMYMYNQTSY